MIKILENVFGKKDASPITRVIGTIFIILAAFAPFVDRVTFFSFEDNRGYVNTATLIWSICQTLIPWFVLLGFIFRAYAVSFLLIVYVYSIQFFWVLMPSDFTSYQTQLIGLGAIILFIYLLKIISKSNKLRDSKILENEQFKKEINSKLENIEMKLKNQQTAV